MDIPGINKTTFQITFDEDWMNKNILDDSILYPYRIWYQLLLQYVTFNVYKAPWIHKI